MDGVDLYWLPLGAGGSFVRLNGRVFETIDAVLTRRRPLDLYHSALEVDHGGDSFVIELTPIPDDSGTNRGVVGEGPVGSRYAGRLRIFRYELRCWRGGEIPDVQWAVGGSQRVATGEERAEALLRLLPSVPMLVWGRDEMDVGEMWNSNSVIAWLLARSGADLAKAHPPAGGRAPGWRAGLAVARAEGR